MRIHIANAGKLLKIWRDISAWILGSDLVGVLAVVDEFLEEGLMIIDVSETFDDAPIILHYDFWKKKLTDGNPFYVLVDLLVTICSCKRHQEAIPRSQQDN